jgi:hypothetical protein
MRAMLLRAAHRDERDFGTLKELPCLPPRDALEHVLSMTFFTGVGKLNAL